MKKIYLAIVGITTLSLGINAQVIFDSGFDEASYTDPTEFTVTVNTMPAGGMEDIQQTVQDDITHHPDWVADHFVQSTNRNATWRSNGSNQLVTSFNFAYSTLGTPITAASGDVITITSIIQLGFDNEIFDSADRNLYLIGLNPSANPTSDNLSNDRDGVVVNTTASGTVALADAGINGFTASPSISQAAKSGYEVIIEYIVGSDAASSSKAVRLRNVTSDETSAVVNQDGLRPQVYDALTGSGAYYSNWAQGFFQMGGISTMVLNRVTIERTTESVLSINDLNKTDISSSVYPNPVSSELTINNIETETYKVVDLSGATVLETAATGTLDVNGLAKGIYFLITDAGTTRFVKQ